jgi:hypothetical protein
LNIPSNKKSARYKGHEARVEKCAIALVASGNTTHLFGKWLQRKNLLSTRNESSEQAYYLETLTRSAAKDSLKVG